MDHIIDAPFCSNNKHHEADSVPGLNVRYIDLRLLRSLQAEMPRAVYDSNDLVPNRLAFVVPADVQTFAQWTFTRPVESGRQVANDSDLPRVSTIVIVE